MKKTLRTTDPAGSWQHRYVKSELGIKEASKDDSGWHLVIFRPI